MPGEFENLAVENPTDEFGSASPVQTDSLDQDVNSIEVGERLKMHVGENEDGK